MCIVLSQLGDMGTVYLSLSRSDDFSQDTTVPMALRAEHASRPHVAKHNSYGM